MQGRGSNTQAWYTTITHYVLRISYALGIALRQLALEVTSSPAGAAAAGKAVVLGLLAASDRPYKNIATCEITIQSRKMVAMKPPMSIQREMLLFKVVVWAWTCVRFCV